MKPSSCYTDTHLEDIENQLNSLRTILQTTNMGTWHLYVKGESECLQPDEKMKEILGIPVNSDMSGEEISAMLESRILPQDRMKFERYSQQLALGRQAECTYLWNHPTLGRRWMRCGGVLVGTEQGVAHFNGYHYDVTDQVTREIRSNNIIRTLAQTYLFINYVNLEDDSFYTYSEKEIDDEDIIRVLMAGSAKEAIRIGVENIVADEYRKDMRAFLSFDTIQERMANTNMLITEFQDVSGVWFELSYAVAERNGQGRITYLLWTLRHIDNEKQIEIRKQKMLEDNILANKAKSKFLQNMSHEIRTPLNAMFGFAQLLGMPEGTNTEEEREQYNTYVYSSYQMLDMLINDIMDVADFEQGNYRIEMGQVAVNEVCNNALHAVDFCVQPGVNTYFTSDFADDYTIYSDGKRIRQVLVNLLTNACKNTLQGELHVHCSRTEHSGCVTFSVTDTGPGIPMEKAQVIFERFTKLNEYAQGAGLGLNICQNIVDKLGGKIYLDTTYTSGARFVFVVDDRQA